MTELRTLKVDGMSCDHCKAAVTKALMALPGVEDVNIDLATGEVKVSTGAPVDLEDVKAAVTAAGYQVVA